MKLFNQTIIAAIITFTGMASAQAADIKSLVKQLQQVSDAGIGVTTFQTGETPRALIEQYYIKENGQMDDEFSFEENTTSIESADGSGYGTATLDAASALTEELAIDMNQPDLSKQETQAKYQQIETVMKQLAQAGAIFGYNASGSGVCGVSYATLFVIDVKTKTIYELIFISGPC